MTGILQYLMQQMLPPDFVASPIFHVPIAKGSTELKHLQETARYILIHGVTFSTIAGVPGPDTITINNVLYLSYRATGNMSGSHWIPHVFEGGTCQILCTDANLFGTVHYQFIKTRV